jgi:hypothetical protein
MYGTPQLGELGELEHFEETMLPMGPGRVAALAVLAGSAPEGRWSMRFSQRVINLNGDGRFQPRRCGESVRNRVFKVVTSSAATRALSGVLQD